MRELLDQLQKIRDELTKVAPGYDGPAGWVFSEIDGMENLINRMSNPEKPVDWTAQC